MGVLRIVLLSIFAAFIAGCAASIPLLPAEENVATTNAQPDSPATTAAISEETQQPEDVEQAEKAKTEAEKPKPAAPKPATAAKPAKPSKTAAASKTSQKGRAGSTTPTVGSPEWKKEQAEDERKEQHIKKVIEGICSGC